MIQHLLLGSTSIVNSKKRKNIAMQKQNELLASIDFIIAKTKKIGLKNELFDQCEKHINDIEKTFLIDKIQALIFSLILSENFAGNYASNLSLSKVLQISPLQMAGYLDHINNLIEKGIVNTKSSEWGNHDLVTNRNYLINQEITLSIMHNTPIPNVLPLKKENIIDHLGSIYQVLEARIEGHSNTLEFKLKFNKEFKEISKFKLFQNFVGNDLTIPDKAVYIWVIWKSIIGAKRIDIDQLCDAVITIPSSLANFYQSLRHGTHPLIKNELLIHHEARFMNDLRLGLSDKSIQLLSKEGVMIEHKSINRDDVLGPNNIVKKALFYNQELKEQVNSITKVLHQKNFEKLHKRLQAKSLPLSTNILFHGGPGTGKTESVLQIAKATKREIIKVEISQMKSMWFGESEKIIKRVFTDYHAYSKGKKILPILFFNEADGILGKRTTHGQSNTKQTENSIQNILLEEIENFQGIFIATTNLVQNLDKAFERRFLFKVEFPKPNTETRSAIWMERMDQIDTHSAHILAQKHELSGGQIENVIRKSEIEFVINGVEPNLEMLDKLCHEEELNKAQNTKIGF
jgi:AAA+ superfamily predicted ATPase